MLQLINVCGNFLHNFAGVSKVMRNTHSPVPKFRPCSPYLLSSTSMLVWSGFFTVWLWITCFHHPLRTGMLYFECDPEKLLKHERKNKSISRTFHHFLFRILKGFKIFSNRELHLPKKCGTLIWWECKWGWEHQEGSSYQVIFIILVFSCFQCFVS